MFKKLHIIACVAALGISAGALADGAGYNCTGNPPTKYAGAKFGNNLWGQCYLDSAVVECKAHQMIDPPAGCVAAGVETQIKMVKNHSMAGIGCKEESKKSWLPTGVTETQCEADVLEFSKHCTGTDPVSCGQ